VLTVEEYPCRLALRVDEVQRAAMGRAAASAGLSMSAWVRSAIDMALEAESASPSKPEKTPQRPVEQSAAVQTFMRAVEAAAKRERSVSR
jgi:hypothetical protein